MANRSRLGNVGVRPQPTSQPQRDSYDVVIVGGATSGWSVAWHLLAETDFDGTVLVVDSDITLRRSATAASNNCMRQQFATVINVEIAQYAAEFVTNFRARLGGDPAVPDLTIRNFGYLYLSDNAEFTEILRRDQQLQAAVGAGTVMVSADEIAAHYPFYELGDIHTGSLNVLNEGAFDATAMVAWMRTKAIELGAESIENTVVGMNVTGDRIDGVVLACGATVTAGTVVNAAGTRAGSVAELAGVSLPIEAHRRYTYIFSAENPLDQDLPLTIDPTGVHFRSYRANDYLAGCPPIGEDTPVDVDDFGYPEPVWENKMEPVVRHRLPSLGRLLVTDSWIGHYEWNRFDRNAIIGAHSERPNMMVCAGFSGHGSQQGPACGRGVAELIAYGQYRTLDLRALAHQRIAENRPLTERAVI